MSRPRASAAGDFDYEAHGRGYAARRQPDPRIAAFIHDGLGDASTVINVGAGAGSYEPRDRYVVPVEPSAAMRRQRPLDAPPAVDAVAEQLPFDDDSFGAAMATVTIHQWADPYAGLRELRRVSRGPVVVLTFDAAALPEFWLNDYLPEVIALEQSRLMPVDEVCAVLGGEADVVEVPIPIDCVDGFGEAYYARPEAFLRPEVRAAQSSWVLSDEDIVARGVRHLSEDLDSGSWDAHHGHLRTQPSRAGALRLIVACGAAVHGEPRRRRRSERS
jgi:SAM-dependent methyltransferase